MNIEYLNKVAQMTRDSLRRVEEGMGYTIDIGEFCHGCGDPIDAGHWRDGDVLFDDEKHFYHRACGEKLQGKAETDVCDGQLAYEREQAQFFAEDQCP